MAGGFLIFVDHRHHEYPAIGCINSAEAFEYIIDGRSGLLIEVAYSAFGGRRGL